MSNKEQLAASYEETANSVKKSNTYAGGFVGGALGGFSGLVGASVLGLSSGGAGFLLVGAAAGVAAVGAYVANKISEREINNEKAAMQNMSAEEVVTFKAKSVSEIHASIRKTREEAKRDEPSGILTAAATIGMMGS